ncbi:MAG: hypothetical protein AB7U83_00375 [Vicinamibacterales bacterium]
MRALAAALDRFYGPLAPPPRDLFGFVAWEIVSARTLPARRDIGWAALKRLPALTPDALFRAAKTDLLQALAMLPGRDERIDELRAASGHMRRHRDLEAVISGPLRGAVRALADVPGLTPSARVRALLVVGGHYVSPVDEGIVRVVARLDGLTHPRPRGLRRLTRSRLGAGCAGDLEQLRHVTLVLGHHAGHACAETAPHCGVCPLATGCRFAGAAA